MNQDRKYDNENVAMQYGDSSFVHMVFFDLTDSLGVTETFQFLDELENLKNIEQVHDFSAGPHLDLNDGRALAQFDICMKMRFNNQEDYKIYQKHPIHLNLKKNVAPVLKSAPRTYDFSLN